MSIYRKLYPENVILSGDYSLAMLIYVETRNVNLNLYRDNILKEQTLYDNSTIHNYGHLHDNIDTMILTL